jgi:uncharacterized protein with HEPN domain
VPNLREIVAFRSVLIHGYTVIDRDCVWRVVEDDLPQLPTALAALLAERE